MTPSLQQRVEELEALLRTPRNISGVSGNRHLVVVNANDFSALLNGLDKAIQIIRELLADNKRLKDALRSCDIISSTMQLTEGDKLLTPAQRDKVREDKLEQISNITDEAFTGEQK